MRKLSNHYTQMMQPFLIMEDRHLLKILLIAFVCFQNVLAFTSNVKYSSERNFTWTSDSATAIGITFYNTYQDTLKYNINTKINDFHMTLKQWSHRK